MGDSASASATSEIPEERERERGERMLNFEIDKLTPELPR